MGLLGKLTGIGLYEPTKAYSFEFIKRKTNKTIAECFLLLPPTEYSLQQGFRVAETKTANGAWVDDFGNDFKQIKIHWDIYFYYMSEVNKAPQSGGLGKFAEGLANDFAGVAKGALSTIGLYDMLSGLDEFFRLRYMLSEGRDLSLIQGTGSALEHPKNSDFKSLGRFKRTEIDKIVEESIASKLNYQDVKVVYHDYDDMNHYEVIIKNFQFNRSARDPWSFTLDVDLLGLQPVYGKGNVTGDIEKFGDPADIFKGISNIVGKLTGIIDKTLTGIANVVSIVGAFTSFLRTLETTINTFLTKQEMKIENFKNQIEDLKEFMGWTSDTANVNQSVLASIPYNTAGDYADYLAGDETIAPSQTMQNYYLLLSEFSKMEVYGMVLSWYNDYRINSANGTIQTTKGEMLNPQLKNYPLYRVRNGDTLANIANKYFGNYSYSQVIAQLNNITFADFENDGMVNKIIKLPIEGPNNSEFFKRNQVMSWKKSDFFKSIYEKQLTYFGIDFKLYDKGFSIDATGDFDIETGQKCWINNLEDRINTPEGELNELNPGFGLPPIVGNTVSSVLIEKFRQNILEQVKKDPRTKSAIIQDFNIHGDQLEATLLLTSVLNEEEVKTFNSQLGVI